MKQVLKLTITFVLTIVMILSTSNIIVKAEETTAIELTPSTTTYYKMGGYNWYCESYDPTTHTAVMQSLGMTSGEWPAYKLSGPYGSTDSPWGAENSLYPGSTNTNLEETYREDGYSIIGLNIANYDDKTLQFYDTA